MRGAVGAASGRLAAFYGAMLDWKTDVSADWADVRADYGQCISFQRVEAYQPPQWPHQPGMSFRVFLEPAGHPFCLCVD
jgi:hypothetical protein